MKVKTSRSIILITGIFIYSLSFIATSKYVPLDPCYEKLYFWFNKDTAISNHSYLNLINDSVFVFADTAYPANWSRVADSLCFILKTNCNKTNSGVLVLNRFDTTRNTWDTRYGKKILFKQCP